MELGAFEVVTAQVHFVNEWLGSISENPHPRFQRTPRGALGGNVPEAAAPGLPTLQRLPEGDDTPAGCWLSLSPSSREAQAKAVSRRVRAPLCSHFGTAPHGRESVLVNPRAEETATLITFTGLRLVASRGIGRQSCFLPRCTPGSAGRVPAVLFLHLSCSICTRTRSSFSG